MPTDFSAGARCAALRATSLSLAARGEVHLVHVLPLSPGIETGVEREAGRRLERLAMLVDKSLRAAGGPAHRVRAQLLRGDAYVQVIRHARAIDAELIVLGRKGLGASASPATVLGTTAARIVRMSDTPVLVVGKGSRQAYRRPLVALPFDPSARGLIELAMRVAPAGSNPIAAVRAYAVPFAGFADPGTDAEPSIHHRQCRDDAETALAAQVHALQRHGIRLRPVLRHGDARSVILAEAERSRADLIAIGTHARSGLAHALLGSVAEWVLGNTRRDVLIARPVRFTFEAP